MKVLALLLLAIASRAEVCPVGNRVFATNFSWDAEGQPDNREGTWGKADYVLKTITFKRVPAGCRVRVLRVYGDLLAWPLGVVPVGTAAGVLMGLQTTAAGGPSASVDWGADSIFLYVQHATKGEVARIPLSEYVDALLERDHQFVVKLAVWLNDTGKKIHVEPTLTVIFRYEKDF